MASMTLQSVWASVKTEASHVWGLAKANPIVSAGVGVAALVAGKVVSDAKKKRFR
jgi:hypothetical protein